MKEYDVPDGTVRIYSMDSPKRATIYDINPDPQKRWFKIRSRIVCSRCKKDTLGDLIIDRKTLKIVDSSGYMFFEEPLCDDCLGDTF